MPIRPENRDRYPDDWELRSYFVRFVRGRGRCEWCGAQHGQAHPVTGAIVVLTTAHVWSEAPEACALLNLAGLCQRCHNRHDGPRRRAGARARRNLALPFEVDSADDSAPPSSQDPELPPELVRKLGYRPGRLPL